MNVIVVDLEMAQPSRKIIQIGAVCMNLKTGFILSQFNQYVNPEEELSEYIIKLTGISQKQVDTGFKIQDALTDFWAWTKDNNCKAVQAWGSDVWELIEESKSNMIVYPHIRSYNIKELATVVKSALPNSASKGGLLATMQTFGLTFEGRQHNALTDAINTAKLLFFIKEQFRQIFEIKKVIK